MEDYKPIFDNVKNFVKTVEDIATRETVPEDPVVRLTAKERHDLLDMDIAGLPASGSHFISKQLMDRFKRQYDYVAGLYAKQAGIPLPSRRKRDGGEQRQLRRGWGLGGKDEPRA